ncbi:MAG: hypothetical protein B6244_03155 [Candidatus Cloacimonetes bacterium 4572_55]|nr:MAG: hypothetical protein B6244_03155 [Candidatus Cloacimonetes bacterium 4572_55]
MTRLLWTVFITVTMWMCGVIFCDARIVFIPPHPTPVPPPHSVGQISISEYSVHVDINRQISHVNVRQVFKNETSRELEGAFIFPLPPDAQVSEFTLIADGRRLEGEVLDKDEARRIYESIVRQNRDPALLEYLDHKLFRARVYPIPPRSERTLEFSYDQILKAEGGSSNRSMQVEFFFPLGHETREVFLDHFEFRVDIQSDLPLRTIYSPTYEVHISRHGQFEAEVAWVDQANKASRLDQDFILYYSLSREDMDVSLLAHRRHGSSDKNDGFFLAFLTPDPEIDQERSLPKDFVFVLDTSGSMKGEKIEQACGALLYCLESLGRRDRFNTITFEADVDYFYPGLVHADNRNLMEAKDFVRSIRARGGTDINSALSEALDMTEGDRPTQIIFLTDGLPTVGEQNIGDILSAARRRNRSSARLFTFGVGYDVNTHLLDLLAEQNHGASDYVRPGEDIEVKVSRLYEKISHPVLTDVDIEFGLPVFDVYPPHISDIFAGSQIIIVGRYRESGWKSISLSGTAGDEKHEWIYEVEFPALERDNDFIPRLWASRKIGFLMDEIRLHGENSELVDEVVSLSEEYGIITPYTSYLVQEERRLSHWDHDQKVIQRRAADHLQEAMEAPTGKKAVESSIASNKLKKGHSSESYALPPEQGYSSESYALPPASFGSRRAPSVAPKSQMKKSKTRAYYLTDGIWVDSRHLQSHTLIKVKPYSPAYFELIKMYPKLRSEFAVGDKLIVSYQNLSIQIDEKGKEKLGAKDWATIKDAMEY